MLFTRSQGGVELMIVSVGASTLRLPAHLGCRAERFGVEYRAPDKWVMFKQEMKVAIRLRKQTGGRQFHVNSKFV